MLVLPLIYLALTIAAGWAVYLFAFHCVPVIWNWHLGLGKFALIAKFVCLATPMVVGSSIAIFMVKPIFAPTVRPGPQPVIDPAVEPQIALLVADVCDSIGAPAPVRIEMDCDVNASARFDGAWGGFVRNRLVLRLGLPLVARLTERELAGVVAHEFGHFRQGAGLRLSYLIRGVNGWFARVIHQRDQWDDALESFTESESGWLSFLSVCASLGIGVSRAALWLLMMVGHGVSALLMRQMEYDADAAEVLVAGSNAFKSTIRKLATMGAVHSRIREDMNEMWQHRHQLPDNLPVLIAERENQLPSKTRTAIENAIEQAKTGWLDTHPCPSDRVRVAEKLAEEGRLLSDAPARELFANFAVTSRAVTLSHYQNDLGIPASTDCLIPVAHLIAQATPRPAVAVSKPATISFNFEEAE